MYCRNCGQENPEQSRFCRHCGASVVYDQMPGMQSQQYQIPQMQAPQYQMPQYQTPVFQAQPVVPVTTSRQRLSKNKKIAIAVIAAIVLLFPAILLLESLSGGGDTRSGNGPAKQDVSQTTAQKPVQNPVQNPSSTVVREEPSSARTEVQPEWVGKSNIADINPGRLYDYLTDDEKKVYRLLDDFLSGDKEKDSVFLDGSWDYTSQWATVFFAYTNDNPYAGDVTTYVRATYMTSTPVEIVFTRLRDLKPDRSQTEAIVNRVAAGLTGSDSEKVRQINDFLREQVQNDTEAAMLFTPYGALVEHRAVCNGYSTAFQAICQKAGIPCYQLWGDLQGSTDRHAWNIVRLEDGNWYENDVLWNDIDANPNLYFCFRTSRLSRERKRSIMGGFETIIPVTQE